MEKEMDIINDCNIGFNFEKLLLTAPSNISGGNHFIKYLFDSNPLYIRTPKCSIKQEIIKTGKKIYCDLMFTNEHEEFIQWLENLENYSQKFIYNKRDKWFETNLEQHDIENSFTSPIKIFKSGKYYILRCIVPNILGKSDLKIYDENENILDIDTLQENTPVVCVLEIQGIKCSPKGFQIDIEIKQLLVLKPSKLFDKCILLNSLSKNSKIDINSNEQNKPDEDTIKETDNEDTIKETHNEDIIKETDNEDTIKETDNEETIKETHNEDTIKETDNEETTKETDNEDTIKEIELSTIDNNVIDYTIDNDNLEKNSINIKNDEKPEPFFLEEIKFNLDEISKEEVVLKNRNDVYYKMYKEAIQKAKIAKDLALSSYLEAKRIKNLYMLDDLSDDDEYEYNDSDNDNEKEFEKI
jgi:hypothetical protein